MQTTPQSEVKPLEFIVMAGRTPVVYLPCTDFIDHDLDEEEDEVDHEAWLAMPIRPDDEGDDRNYMSSLYEACK